MTPKPYLTTALGTLLALAAPADALTYTLAWGNENWPADKRAAIIACMDEAVATYNAYGIFDKHVTANYNPGVPTAQAGYDGWIDFGGSIGTRVAMHEISHTLGIGTYWSWTDGGWWGPAANARIKLYEGQNAGIGTGGSHFWPYGLNYDNEDTSQVARERHCKMVAAMRWDMGIVVDSDGDAMPDDWEVFNFGNLNSSAAGDPDGDGVPNVDEYNTDSNPNAAGPISGVNYQIRAGFSGKVLDVLGASTADGGNVVQWSGGSGLNQRWIAWHLGGGWYRFENVNSGKTLETAGMGMNDGDNVQQWTWLNNFGQQWRLTGGANGNWRICNRQSGKVLDVAGVSQADGANIQQWTDWGGQLWTFDAPAQAPVFTSNPLNKPSGIVGMAYSGSIATDANDPNAGDTLTFSKVSGPAWLAVASNGALSGTPPTGSGGVNSFTVRVTDPGGLYSEANLSLAINHPMPAGWTSADVGAVSIPGGASEGYSSPGTYTLSGSGADIWDSADAFQFTRQTLSGDGEIRARITSQINTDPWAKAGVMIRDGSGAGATHALMTLTPGNGFSFQWRGTASGASNFVTGSGSNAAPNNWVRLTRSGSLLTGYVSTDGVTWTQQGSTSIAMSGSVLVGLAVSSHNNALLGGATFDNVAITPYPSPWLGTDVGSTGLSGGAEYFGGAHTLKGAGVFGGTTDAFRYVYQTLSADGSIIARVSTLQNTGSNARVGIMMRDTLANNARMAALTVTGTGAYKWQRRTSTGGSVTTTNSSSGTVPNIWIRLVRSGNTITASKSTNGTSWTTISSATVTMASNCYVGLAVASGSTTTLNTSVFNNLTVVP